MRFIQYIANLRRLAENADIMEERWIQLLRYMLPGVICLYSILVSVHIIVNRRTLKACHVPLECQWKIFLVEAVLC